MSIAARVSHIRRASVRFFAVAALALAGVAATAPASHADACKVVWRTVADNVYGNQQYLKVNWCYNGSTVTSHTWTRGEGPGAGQTFTGYTTSQSGGNGSSFFSITSHANFAITYSGLWSADPWLRIDVNKYGNYAIYQSSDAHYIAGY